MPKPAPSSATPAPSPSKILWLDELHDRLADAPHLGEYDAIVLDDQASAVAEGYRGLPPGKMIEVPLKVAEALRFELRQRAAELDRMLYSGGILVVRLRELSAVQCLIKGPLDIYPRSEVVCFAEWWLPSCSRLNTLRSVEQPIISGGSGNRIIVDEPDHAFEPYLMTARYSAVLESLVFADPNDLPEPLATNPVRNVVACQIAAGRGLVLLVPADGDLEILASCLNDLLLIRHASDEFWHGPEELTLLARYREVTEHLREERQTLLTELGRVREQKTRIFEDVDVRRIVSRLNKATDASTSVKASLVSLYNLLEIIEGRFGGEASMIRALGIPKSAVNELKRPANEERFDVRHSTPGQPEALDADTKERALTAATRIAQAFVSYLYEQAAEGGAPDTTDLS
jgi:hypothetical protein